MTHIAMRIPTKIVAAFATLSADSSILDQGGGVGGPARAGEGGGGSPVACPFGESD